MKEIKIPNKILFVRSYGKFTYGTDAITINGSALACDNKSLKKFTAKYERIKNSHKTSSVPELEFDNVPTSGYKIYPVQSYGKNFDFAKVVHPSGTVISIPIQNVFDLMCTSKIENGIVQDELFFDENLWLVGVNSTRWKRIKRLEELAEQARAAKDSVKIGSVVITQDGQKKTYCGKLHALYVKKSMEMVAHDSSELLHIFLDWNSGNYHITKNIINNNYTVSPSVVSVDLDKVLKECNEQIMNGKSSDFFDPHNFPFYENAPILFHTKKFTSSDVKYEIIDGNYNDFDTKDVLTFITKLDLIKDGDDYYLPMTFRSDNDLTLYRYAARHSYSSHLKYKSGYGNKNTNVVLMAIKVEFVDGVLTYPNELKAYRYHSEQSFTKFDHKSFPYNQNINLKIGKPYIQG